MNINQLKKFAQSARRKLLEQVGAKLEYVLNTDTVELRERAKEIHKLKDEIARTNKAQVIEKVAYTWFNRLMALRFMDANDYQPAGIRIISPKKGYTLPELLNEAKQGSLLDSDEWLVDSGLGKRVNELLDGKIPSSNPQNEAYRLLLIAACNTLHKQFPFLFEPINDYTELLLPDDLTSEFSIVHDIVEGMTTEDCREVEIIGWLYQFYISEKKDEVFASKSKVKKEDIPAATQLFTPRWIVEYMVQNTLGKLWLQNKPNSRLRKYMPYFIESPSMQSKDYLKVNSVEDITLLDQACGSGHILVYAFELFTRIYEEEGYNPSEIPQLIIEKNLFGFEIDERAAQLAGMALMMKARSYQRRVFRKEIKPNILCYKDLRLNEDEIKDTFRQIVLSLSAKLSHDLDNMQQATNLGSLISPHTLKSELESALVKVNEKTNTSDAFLNYNLKQIKQAIEQLLQLGKKYHCIVDNPPYMGARKMQDNLKIWLKSNYPESYQDLFSCFIVRIKGQLKPSGLSSLVTLQGWMFVSTFSNFRKWLLENYSFNSLIQIGGNSFPSLNSQVARAVTFTFENKENQNDSNTICFELDSVPRSHNVDKMKLFEDYLKTKSFTTRNFNRFQEINRYTFLHSINEELLQIFIDSTPFELIAKPKQGLATGSNDKFVRFWHEVTYSETYWQSQKTVKWHPYNKGGDYRKWYGNNDNIVNWDNNGFEIKNFRDHNGKLRSRPQNESYYFKEGVTYSLIGNSDFCARKYDKGFLFDVGGSGFFPGKEDMNFLLGLVNSSVGSYLLSRLNPTVNFQVGDIGSIPVVKEIKSSIRNEINELVNQCIEKSVFEWKLYEENPDFKLNECINYPINNDLEETFDNCGQRRKILISKLYKSENRLDTLFSRLYKINLEKIKKSKKISIFDNIRIKEESELSEFNSDWHSSILIDLISYSVGCMFGRYSIDEEGLILANQGETISDFVAKVQSSKFKIQDITDLSFVPDDDNIIPVLDDEWFEDDIVGRFYEFLKVTFGKKNFDKNLAFVEDCLEKDIRKYFARDFYSDHIKRYKKRPIYWMFSSPKGYFNVLIYMHRYTQDTINNILNNYLREFIEKLKTRKEHWNQIKISGIGSDQTKAIKEIDKLDKMLLDCQEYERDILRPFAMDRIPIDLDDGVLVNYNKFGKAIREVKGLNDKKTKEKVKGFDWVDMTMIK